MPIAQYATPATAPVSRRRFVRVAVASAAAAVAMRDPWLRIDPVAVLEAQGVALKDVVPKGWLIGAAINQNQSDGRDTVAVDLVTRQFNTISPENLLKFQSLHPEPDRYTFEAPDRYVAFGRTRGMAVIGHNLVWHSQTPRWVWDGPDGGLTDRATMLARLRAHITTVVGRYKGQIRGWDVVNEALNEDGTLRDSPWRRGIGDDYIAQAFAFAHDADPDVELYYNDYNLATSDAKRAGAIRIIKDLQRRNIRIDAVGEQGHWRLGSPTASAIDTAITELRATGVKVLITELDVNLLPPAGARGEPPTPETNPYANGLPDTMQQALARYYADAFRVFLKHRDDIGRVTFWGVSDGDSWLNRGRVNHPLLWDRQRRPKPAFDEVVKVLTTRPLAEEDPHATIGIARAAAGGTAASNRNGAGNPRQHLGYGS
jgi:endo-1,4-beta-xylanase